MASISWVSTTPRSSIYGYSRAEFEKLTIRKPPGFGSEPPWASDRSQDELAARTWKHVKRTGP